MSQSTSAPGVSSLSHGPRASDARPDVAATIDRWIFVFMAGLFLATVLAGFVPDSFVLVKGVQSGLYLPLPPILHVHAVLMGSWLLLLMAQTALVAAGHRALHRKLGLTALALAPAMVVAGLILVPTLFHQFTTAAQVAAPARAALLKQTLQSLTNVVLLQLQEGVVFLLLVALAVLVRRSDPATHKRLMILATAVPLHAAIGRLPWLPALPLAVGNAANIYMLLWISPMFAWDLFRTGGVHRAYWIWIAANVPFLIAIQFLWGSPWWLATVPKLMGVS